MHRIHHALILMLATFALVLTVGCQIGGNGGNSGARAPMVNPPATIPTRVVDNGLAPTPVPPSAALPNPGIKQPRHLPRITSEPQIGVLLATGPEVVLNLPRGGVIHHGGANRMIPAGDLRVRSTGKGLTTSATGKDLLGDTISIEVRPQAGAPTFIALLDPPFGKPVKLNFSGQPQVSIDRTSRKALLIERVGLEQYLRGVLPTEISPSWPLEAIKAQAVAARSYTVDRYLVNNEQPWQLHWHYTVDMAYGGLKPVNERMAAALDQTRGQLLATSGLPIPALFHACSGGRTESAQNFRPKLMGADGVTDMTAAMPSVNDPDGILGAEALGFSTTHLNWTIQLPMTTVTEGLKKWASAHPEDHLEFGQVSSVRTVGRFSDSGRVAKVTVRHLLGNHETDTEIPATTFRLAVGPGQIRSTNWTRCVTASAKGGTLVIDGHGYGHGVGLSQVSAYQMARTGSAASDILSRFYPGAKLVQWW
jgi:stage II sporulation protein D